MPFTSPRIFQETEDQRRPQFCDGIRTLLFSVLLTTIEDYIKKEPLAVEDVRSHHGDWIFSFQAICDSLCIDSVRLRSSLSSINFRQWKRIKREYDLMFRSRSVDAKKQPQKDRRSKICPTCGVLFTKDTKFCCRRCVRFTKKRRFQTSLVLEQTPKQEGASCEETAEHLV